MGNCFLHCHSHLICHSRAGGNPGKVMVQKKSFIYIMANKRNGTIYIGVTSDLLARVWQHKNNMVEGFTSRYNTHTLVYFEQPENMQSAIEREKQIKKWNRKWKLRLIEKLNPGWKDLYEGIV